MKLKFINLTEIEMSEEFFSLWIRHIVQELRGFSSELKMKISEKKKELSLVFLSEEKMLDLNLKFRNKRKLTDVLSFEGVSSKFFGEIVLCPQFILKKKHFKSFHKECAYLILHAFLHLLGFDHEKNEKEAKFMYSLQDKIFFEGIEKVEGKAKHFHSKKRKIQSRKKT